ncbi:universal stress protein [Mycolicibacterium novocastrense]|uniref:Universal stress protein UspA-like protein n=1 Tax=Mycolicibacterium novocastrense TaxID=59813 RepID=A0ABQ0KFU7_MYCNV|nr:universal stress protein [Mycolicibacterium novocastrense]GAT08106.1 universal stress protein UspA-like protein [Mycolicibacterium novocastrense]
MTEKSGIVVGVDGSAESDAAIGWATKEAVMREQPITLVHAIPPVITTWPGGLLDASYLEAQEVNARDVLEKAQKTVHTGAGDSPAPKIEARVVNSSPPWALAEASRDAVMTVVGTRGLGAIGRAVVGSVSSGLLHHGHGPVAVVHAEYGRAADRSLPVLLGVDGSPASEGATALAFEEASRRGVDLVALHAWSDVGVFPALGMDWHRYEDQGHEILAERLAGWQEQYPDVPVHRRIVCDQPARWLVDTSQEAQLVVVGSHGRGGFAGLLLGSVAGKVAHAAAAPVIVVRPR